MPKRRSEQLRCGDGIDERGRRIPEKLEKLQPLDRRTLIQLSQRPSSLSL